MATVEMVMPKMGESIMEGTILSWLKKEGDAIEEEESVLEVATDKVDTEVPSSHAGVLKQILAQEGDVVAVGKPIAIIEINGEVNTPTPEEAINQEDAAEVAASFLENNALKTPAKVDEDENLKKSDRFYSPLVQNIAKTENISFEELEKIPGSGKDGRVTKLDILSFIENRKTQHSQSATHEEVKVSQTVTPYTTTGEDEIIEMDRMRKMIAERMVASKQISPHVTSFVEADVTNLVKWRGKYKSVYAEKEGQTLTFTPIFIEAIIKAIKDFPMINISVEGSKIIKKGSVNIGMAVALPSGNLIVPVIHNADQLNLLGIVKKVNDLSKRARENKLKPDELSGGTYTVSNVGSFGNVMGTPIIMQPQVAIMATGAIQKKPAVVETPEGDFIGIRHKMFLSHSYDHRVVDGALGGMFVRKVADYLENFDTNRVFN